MLLLLVDILLLGCLIAAPLMYGTVDPWSQIPLAIVSLIMLNIALAVRPKILEVLVRLPWVWLGGGMLVLILFQLVPLPPQLIKIISPATFAFYFRYLPGGNALVPWRTLSLYPSASIDGLIQFLIYACVFLTVLIRINPSDESLADETRSVSSRKAQYLMLGCLTGVLSLLFHSLYDFNLHVTANGVYFVTLLALGIGAVCFKGYDLAFFRRTVNFIIVFGFLVAIFAIIQKFNYNGHIYWIGMQAPNPVGPYFNYDHYAGFMELCGALAVSMVVASIFHTSFFHCKGFVNKVLWFATKEANKAVRFLFMAVVMVSTIFISTSRGGIMSFVISMLIFFLIVILTGWRVGKNKRAGVLFVVIGLLISVMVYWLGPERFLQRFHLLSIQKIMKMEGPDGVRLLIYKDTLPVIRDFSQVGTGLNTFATHFTRYRNFDLPTQIFVNYTHNDYLQLISETGIGGVIFLIIFLGLYVIYLRRVIRKLE